MRFRILSSAVLVETAEARLSKGIHDVGPVACHRCDLLVFCVRERGSLRG